MSLQIRPGALDAKVFVLRRDTFKLADRFRPNPAVAFFNALAFYKYPSSPIAVTDKIIGRTDQRDWSYYLSMHNELTLLIRRRAAIIVGGCLSIYAPAIRFLFISHLGLSQL
jgi:hypothetical protein